MALTIRSHTALRSISHDRWLITLLCHDVIGKVALLSFRHPSLLQDAQHVFNGFSHWLAHHDSSLYA